MTVQVTANPNIGCKYPATCNGILVRSMASIILKAAGLNPYPKPQRLMVNLDPNEGEARHV